MPSTVTTLRARSAVLKQAAGSSNTSLSHAHLPSAAMFKLSFLKCFFIANFCALVVLAVLVVNLFKHWRVGERLTRFLFKDPMEEEYERQVLQDEARVVPGLGGEGRAADLFERRGGEQSWRTHGINVYLSDRISYKRSLEDLRHPDCASMHYHAELPSASVVIVFRDEPYSVLLRTVWSVLTTARRDRPWYDAANFIQHEPNQTLAIGYPGQEPDSEHVYLKEIILVDDNSTLPELRGKLSHYVRTRLPSGLVRLLRLPKWSGLIRARQAGARAARGDALLFLDAHCEGLQDWIRPLLQRVKDKRTAVVTPIIHLIHAKSFEFHDTRDLINFSISGFAFSGHSQWIYVPEHEWLRRGFELMPTWSPTMLGAIFAVSRSYYWELGGYDEQMTGWGGENLEMSFRVWQCGGSLETIPCSRAGHVFRSPGSRRERRRRRDTHGMNMARVAEVWMDDYAELFYLHRPDTRNNPRIGDVSERRALRERLRCRSFQWYLDTVYLEKFVPVRDAEAFGRVQNSQPGLCLDSTPRPNQAVGSALGLRPCLPTLNVTQHFSLTPTGQFRDEENCIQLQEESDGSPLVLLMACDSRLGGLQWTYTRASRQLRHERSGLCLDARAADADVRARACSDRGSQRWLFDYDRATRRSGNLFPPGVEERLLRLRRRRPQESAGDQPRPLVMDPAGGQGLP